MISYAFLFVLIGCFFGMFTAGSGAAATVGDVLKKIQNLPAAQRRATLEEGAKSEGQVVFYTSVSLTDYPKILAAFEQAYPTIKTNAFRSTPSGVVRRADTEAKAGRHAVDVIGSAPVETSQLRQLQLATSYLSPERNALFKGAFDPEGYWTAFDVTPIVLAFNTKLVSQQEAPKTYQDLLQPKWKGKMSLGTEDYEWFGAVLDSMGKDKGLEYMKALAKQDLHMPGSSSVMRVQLLLGGESAIAVAARGRRVAEFKSKGAPIDFRLFDPVFSRARHARADATCFPPARGDSLLRLVAVARRAEQNVRLDRPYRRAKRGEAPAVVAGAVAKGLYFSYAGCQDAEPQRAHESLLPGFWPLSGEVNRIASTHSFFTEKVGVTF